MASIEQRESSMTEERVTKAGSLALTVTDVRVTAISRRLRLRPETLIARLQRELPSLIEQQFYLTMGPEFAVRPESFAKLLRVKLGSRELQAHDLVDREVGNNLVISRISDLADYMENSLTLVGKIQADFANLGLSMETAGRLALAYGSYAENILDSIVNNVGEIRMALGMRESKSDGTVIRVAVDIVVKHSAGRSGKPRPNVLDVLELFDAPYRQEEL